MLYNDKDNDNDNDNTIQYNDNTIQYNAIQYPWAMKGKKCNKFTHFKRFKAPIATPFRGQTPYIKLKADKPEHQEIARRVQEQIADNEWEPFDMTPLEGAANAPDSGRRRGGAPIAGRGHRED